MKKALILLLALPFLFSSCGNESTSDAAKESETPQTQISQTEETSASHTESEVPTEPEYDDGLTVKTDGKVLTVSVDLPSCAGKDLSVLLLSENDKDWETHTEKVIDLDQLPLDASGKGSVTLTAKEEGTFFLLVTYEGGSALREVTV